MQRYQFAKYHVTDPGAFYQKNAWWVVPKDPERPTKLQPPYRLFVEDPDTGVDNFALTSVYVPYEKNNLAAFVSVDSDATSPTYGRIKVLQLPNENTPGPGNIANEMQSDPDVTEALLPLQQGGASRVTYGNLLTLPVTGGLMYVQPIYATRQLSDASYPILRYVTVSYGDKVGIGEHPRERDHRRPRRRHDDPAARTAARTTRPPTTPATSRPGCATCSTRPRSPSRPPTRPSRPARSASGPPSSRRVARRSTRPSASSTRRTADRRADRRADRWGHPERRGDARRVTDPRFGWPCAVE